MRRGFPVLKECDQTSCSIRKDFRFARKEGRRKKIFLGLGDLAHPVINYNHTEKKNFCIIGHPIIIYINYSRKAFVITEYNFRSTLKKYILSDGMCI